MDMCFSATASFIAAGALTTIGMVTLRQVTAKRELLWGSIPLLFGIQQALEGGVWLTFGSGVIHSVFTYAYGMFSNVLWPTFLPLAVLLLETNPDRKKVIRRFAILGFLVSLYLLYFIVTGGIWAEVLGYCLAYHSPIVWLYPAVALYLIAVAGSCIFSSHKMVRVFGVIAFVSALLTMIFLLDWFLSVWCFFSAILSILIYWHFRIKTNTQKGS